MGLLLFYLATVGSSYFITLTTAFQMFKDIGDAGYKFKVEKMSELADLISPDQKRMNLVTRLIPIINIFAALGNGVDYIKNREDVLYQLSLYNAVEEMTDEEKSYYSLKPSAIRSLKIAIDSSVETKKQQFNIELKAIKTEEGTKLAINGSEDMTYDQDEAVEFIYYGVKKYKSVAEFMKAYKADSKKVYEEYLDYCANQEKTDLKKNQNKESSEKTKIKKK